ncbi:MAG: ABC transporter permease [Chloroflexi bacterium]|nr:ABC transporter permease [Chloroflexota bacterium]
MPEIINLSIIGVAIRMATPLLLSSLGGVVAYRAGILNVGMEGMMLAGAFSAVVFSMTFGSSTIGLIAAGLIGLLAAMLTGLIYNRYKGDVFVIGMAINIGALGLTNFLMRSIFGTVGAISGSDIIGFPKIEINAIKEFPVLRDVFTGNPILVYASWGLVLITFVFLNHTRVGLNLRAVGENPEAAAAAGLNNSWYRYLGIALSGISSGFAGAYLALGQLSMFTENMTAGRGFIALAIIIFGRGTAEGALLGSLLFGFAEAVAMQLQGASTVPPQFVLMIPYVLTVVALTIFGVGRSRRLST